MAERKPIPTEDLDLWFDVAAITRNNTEILVNGHIAANQRIADLERQLTVAREEIDGLRRRIHLLEGHNQFFDRCESAW